MKQFELQNNLLRLRVKKAHFLLRAFLFFCAFVFFILPSTLTIVSIIDRSFHFGFLISIIGGGFFGFLILRNYLWNSFGEELIEFKPGEISYEANYRWFKDGKRNTILEEFYFGISPVGYVEDNLGVLIIMGGKLNIDLDSEVDEINHLSYLSIESVVKMPIDQLEELIELLDLKFRPDEVD